MRVNWRRNKAIWMEDFFSAISFHRLLKWCGILPVTSFLLCERVRVTVSDLRTGTLTEEVCETIQIEILIDWNWLFRRGEVVCVCHLPLMNANTSDSRAHKAMIRWWRKPISRLISRLAHFITRNGGTLPDWHAPWLNSCKSRWKYHHAFKASAASDWSRAWWGEKSLLCDGWMDGWTFNSSKLIWTGWSFNAKWSLKMIRECKCATN